MDEFGRLIGRKAAVLAVKRLSECIIQLPDRENKRRKRLYSKCNTLGIKTDKYETIFGENGENGNYDKNDNIGNGKGTEGNMKSSGEVPVPVKSALKGILKGVKVEKG